MGTAVVTGAASGIGLRIAERLLHDGWTVWGLDVRRAELAGNPLLSAAGSYFTQLVCDVGDEGSVRAAAEAVRERAGSVDALVCSAGVVRPGALGELSVDDVDLMLAVNVRGPWLSVREFLPLLRESAGPAGPSRVLVIGSISGIRPKTGSGFYGASKAAAHILVGVYAAELAKENILVNAIAPGTIDTPMLSGAIARNAGGTYAPSGVSPLGRIGTPDDIADVALFLLGDHAGYVTGTVLPVDGGTRAAFNPTGPA